MKQRVLSSTVCQLAHQTMSLAAESGNRSLELGASSQPPSRSWNLHDFDRKRGETCWTCDKCRDFLENQVSFVLRPKGMNISNTANGLHGFHTHLALGKSSQRLEMIATNFIGGALRLEGAGLGIIFHLPTRAQHTLSPSLPTHLRLAPLFRPSASRLSGVFSPFFSRSLSACSRNMNTQPPASSSMRTFIPASMLISDSSEPRTTSTKRTSSSLRASTACPYSRPRHPSAQQTSVYASSYRYSTCQPLLWGSKSYTSDSMGTIDEPLDAVMDQKLKLQ